MIAYFFPPITYSLWEHRREPAFYGIDPGLWWFHRIVDALGVASIILAWVCFIRAGEDYSERARNNFGRKDE